MDIYLVPVKFFNSSLLKRLEEEISRLFTSKVSTIELHLEVEKAYSQDRAQYFSTQLIAEAMNLTQKINGKILLLTELDLFVPVLTFVFGEAQLDGKHSIISVCRLHEEFYSGRSDDELLLKRTRKEILHELGHNYGLKHCWDWDCVMHSSLSIEEVDIKGDTYCKTCKANVSGYRL